MKSPDLAVRLGIRCLAAVLLIAASAPAFADGVLPPCDAASLTTAGIFFCGTPQDLPPLTFGVASTYQSSPQFFPGHWDQLDLNQQHNPVFPVSAAAPAFLQQGAFWVAPLTGDEFLRLAHAFQDFGSDPEKWGSEAAQWLGNVMSVSLVQGIAYVQLSRNELYALDAASGVPIWCRCRDPLPGMQALPPLGPPVVNAAMGQDLVEQIGGRPVVFVTVGDVGFTIQHAFEFKANVSAVRGANFSSVYALDGLTGQMLWRFDTPGEEMPTPVYKNGVLFVNTGDGHLYSLDAATGNLLSAFANPGLGFSSMSSVDWFRTASGRLFMIYGTQHPGNMVAVDVTNPTSPMLAWSYHLARAFSTGLGDVPPAVDPVSQLVVTDGLIRVGTKPDGSPQLDVNVFALDANTGALRWSRLACADHYADRLAGCSVSPVSFRGSVPMVHDGNLYVGVLLDETYRSYRLADGTLRWATSLHTPGESELQQPRGGGVWYEGRVLEAEGRQIFTFDPATGAILNDFRSPGYFAVWGIPSPVVVGNELYIGAISGWVFAAPAHFIMTSSGGPPSPIVPPSTLILPPRPPEYFDPAALPTPAQAAAFPATWLAYAGGQDHNAVIADGPAGVYWQTPLNAALPLADPPRDEAIFGTEVASHMTTLAFGVGSGLAPARGIIYTASDRYTVNALNGYTGQVIWRFRTINANFGQPIVTPKTVVTAAGDPWLNFSQVNKLALGKRFHVGASFSNLHGLDPLTGRERWTFYTIGTNAMTPLYDRGHLYWVSGSGHLWAIDADTGAPVAPFLDASGLPALPPLAGDNAHDSANIYRGEDADLMVVGTMDAMYGVDLATGATVWTQAFPGFSPYGTGFAGASPAVAQDHGLVVGTFIANADPATGTATLEGFALDARNGTIVWIQNLGAGPTPTGFTAATPVLHEDTAYVLNPLNHTEAAVAVTTGTIRWQSTVPGDGRLSWGPGVVVGERVVQPAGSDLDTFDRDTGTLVNQVRIGGAFTFNNPTVLGQTLYIGNGWGWALALPLSSVLGSGGGGA